MKEASWQRTGSPSSPRQHTNSRKSLRAKCKCPTNSHAVCGPTAFEYTLFSQHATLSSTVLSFHNKMSWFLFLTLCSGKILCPGPHEACPFNRWPWNTGRWSLHSDPSISITLEDCGVRSLAGEVWGASIAQESGTFILYDSAKNPVVPGYIGQWLCERLISLLQPQGEACGDRTYF